MRKGKHTGGCSGRGSSRLSEFIPFQMGLQIPCCVYPLEATEGVIWGSPEILGADLPCLGSAERMSDSGRSCDADHVQMCISIPPKYPVASVIGFLKGKSAIAGARELCGRERNFTGEHLWARGYAVSTVGFELEQVHQYIRSQEEADGSREPL